MYRIYIFKWLLITKKYKIYFINSTNVDSFTDKIDVSLHNTQQKILMYQNLALVSDDSISDEKIILDADKNIILMRYHIPQHKKILKYLPFTYK